MSDNLSGGGFGWFREPIITAIPCPDQDLDKIASAEILSALFGARDRLAARQQDSAAENDFHAFLGHRSGPPCSIISCGGLEYYCAAFNALCPDFCPRDFFVVFSCCLFAVWANHRLCLLFCRSEEVLSCFIGFNKF